MADAAFARVRAPRFRLHPVSEYRSSRRRAGGAGRGEVLAAAVAVVVVFVAGIGLGEALTTTRRGGTQTLVRTLGPLPLVPATGTTGAQR